MSIVLPPSMFVQMRYLPPKQSKTKLLFLKLWAHGLKYYQNSSRLWQSSMISSSSYSRMPLHSCKFHIHSFFNSKSASLMPLQFLQLPHLRISNTFKTVIVESLAMTAVFILHDPFNIASISLTIQVQPMVNADWLWFSYTAVFHILFSWWMSGCDCSFFSYIFLLTQHCFQFKGECRLWLLCTSLPHSVQFTVEWLAGSSFRWIIIFFHQSVKSPSSIFRVKSSYHMIEVSVFISVQSLFFLADKSYQEIMMET